MRSGRGVALLVLALAIAGCTGSSSSSAPKAREVRSIGVADVEVFMRLTATTSDASGVRAAIRRSPSVRTFAYLSQQDALRVFRKLYRYDPVVIATTTADELPTSFVIRLVDPNDAKPLVSQLSELPGVDEVKDRHNGNDDGMRKKLEGLCAQRQKQTGPGDVEVFLNVRATAAETEAIRRSIEHAPVVRDWVFLTKDDALRVFRELFADRPELIATTPAHILPTSFRLDLALGEPTIRFLDRLASMPGVDEISERITAGQCAALGAFAS